MQYWLVKSEPETYSFDDLIKDKKTLWDGVRNYQARNNLRLMKIGDEVLVYHSVSDKEVVGIAVISKEYFSDPTDESGAWSVVEMKPLKKLRRPVSLEQIKNEKTLLNTALIKQSRLSVMPLTSNEFKRINALSE